MRVNNFNVYDLPPLVIGGITLLSVSSFNKSFVPFAEIPVNAWLSIGYLVLFGSIIAFICYLYALQNLPTEQASIYAYINPVVAVLLGAWIFNERLTMTLVVGGSIALLGVYLVNKAFRRTADEQREVLDN